MSLNREPLTQAEQAAIDLIKNHRAIVSTHADISIDNSSDIVDKKILDHADTDNLVNQLLDPNKNRPSRTAALFATFGIPRPAKLTKTNRKTGEKQEYAPGMCRETKHKGVQFTHTAKTAASLLPPEPEYMNLFGNENIAYIWDINDCDLKDERYVSEVDGWSDECCWLSPNPYQDASQMSGPPRTMDDYPRATSVAELRENNLTAVSKKTVIPYNELVIGLPKIICGNSVSTLKAMGATRDTLINRLRVWNQMLRDKSKHGCEMPLFIIQSDRQDGKGSVFRVYGSTERHEDLANATALLQKPGELSDEDQAILSVVVSELNISLKSQFKLPQSLMIFSSRLQDEFISRSRSVKKPICHEEFGDAPKPSV